MKKRFTFLLASAALTASAQTQYLDSSFHQNGLQDSLVASFTPQSSGLAKAVAIQSDGKILLALEMQNKMNLMRLNADGTKDGSFATGGLFQESPSSVGSTTSMDVVVQPDGKILFLGKTYFSSQADDIVLYRLLPNGTPDNSFGTNGQVITSAPGNNSYDVGNEILLRPNGKIVVVGSTNTRSSDDKHLLIQYKADGTLDAGFGTGGIAVRAPAGKAVFGKGGLLQPDGKVVVYGAQYQGNGSVGIIARYDTSGNADAGFGSAGYHEEKVHNNQATSVKTAALQSNGSMVLSLYAIPDTMHAVRITNSGNRDLTFGNNGITAIKAGGFSDWGFLEKIMVLPGDSLLFGANAVVNSSDQYDFTALRLTPAGIVDSSWGTNGKIVADFHHDYDNLYDIALQTDGKIVACGSSRQNNGTSYGYPSIARFKMVSRTAPAGVTVPGLPTDILGFYPNPTNGIVHLEGIQTGDRIAVWNALGQLVIQQTVTASFLDLKNLPQGLYHVQVVRQEAVIGQGRLLKE